MFLNNKYLDSTVYNLISWLPIAATIVPQGTFVRYYIGETIFLLLFAFTFLLAIISIFQVRKAVVIKTPKIMNTILRYILYIFLINFPLALIAGNSFRGIFIGLLPSVCLTYSYLLINFKTKKFIIPKILNNFQLSGILISFIIITSYFFIGIDPDSGRITQLKGIGILVLPIILIGGSIIFSKIIVETKKSKKVFLIVQFIFLSFSVVLTETRVLIVSLLIGCICSYIFIASKSNLKFKVGNIFLILIILTTLLLNSSDYLSRFNLGEIENITSGLGRIEEYYAFFDAFKISPIIGNGLGTIISRENLFDYSLAEGITIPHSHFFYHLAITGIVGIVFYYHIFLRIFYNLNKIKKFKNSDMALCYGSILGGITSSFIFTLTSTTFNSPSYCLFISFSYYCIYIFEKDYF